MSDLRLTETGNAGPLSELERKRLEAIERMKAWNVKRLDLRRGNSPQEKWADKEIR